MGPGIVDPADRGAALVERRLEHPAKLIDREGVALLDGALGDVDLETLGHRGACLEVTVADGPFEKRRDGADALVEGAAGYRRQAHAGGRRGGLGQRQTFKDPMLTGVGGEPGERLLVVLGVLDGDPGDRLVAGDLHELVEVGLVLWRFVLAVQLRACSARNSGTRTDSRGSGLGAG